MKQIPDDPIIRSMERTGYPPFMTRCLNKMVKNGSDDEIDWEDDEIDGENDREERSIQTDQGRPFFPVIDGRELQNIPVTSRQKEEIESTIDKQPRDLSLTDTPCFGECAGRNVICHSTCPAYKMLYERNERQRRDRLLLSEAKRAAMANAGKKASRLRQIKPNARIAPSI